MKRRHAMSAAFAAALLLACGSSQAEPPKVEKSAAGAVIWRERVRRDLAELKPHTTPPTAGHPVDAFLDVWWRQNGLAPAAACDDGVFLRRVHLDLVGLLPDERTTADFLADRSPKKREKLVDRLLSNRQAYAEHWMTFFNDLLRNDEVELLVVKRQPITQWLYRSLLENKPYDLFAAELIAPGPDGPTGFIEGIDWEWSTSASEIPAMQAARSVAQVFQGVNLKCASCHDDFSKRRTLDEAWALAACFADKPIESQRCEKPTGRVAKPRFLFNGLGDFPVGSTLSQRRAAVAIMVTRPRNPRFAKVIVNRLFRQLFGQGIAEQVDDLDESQGFHPELLDYLAGDLMRHDYDLKHTLRLLATSRAYQRRVMKPTRDLASGKEPPPFGGPRVKRMTAEQFVDAVSTLTGYWPRPPLMKVDVPGPAVRAWRHRNADSLATVLGRPARDVVNSSRSEGATVVQALEMINGAVLGDRLEKGAARLLASPLGREPDIAEVANILCRRAYCRAATAEEIAQGRSLLGSPQDDPKQRLAGWEDFLWLVVVRPEFQYIE